MNKIIQSENGLTVRVDDDGVWLEFKSSKGKSALVLTTAISVHPNSIVDQAIKEWSEDIEEISK